MARLVQNILVLLASTFVALYASDQLFRWYDTRYLLPKITLDQNEIDLSKLHYNDTTINRKKAQSEFRILSFGDEAAWGLVPYSTSYHSIIGKKLETVIPNSNVRVVNLGIPNNSFQDYIRDYFGWSSVLEHDAVIVTISEGNDLFETPTWDTSPINKTQRTEAWLRSSLFMRTHVPFKNKIRMLDYLSALVVSKKFRHRGSEQYREISLKLTGKENPLLF